MSDQRDKIAGFLHSKLNERDDDAISRIDLVYSPRGHLDSAGDEVLRTWANAGIGIDQLAAEIEQLSEAHAASRGVGRHRYVLSAIRIRGGHYALAFTIGIATDTEVGLDPTVSLGANEILASGRFILRMVDYRWHAVCEGCGREWHMPDVISKLGPMDAAFWLDNLRFHFATASPECAATTVCQVTR